MHDPRLDDAMLLTLHELSRALALAPDWVVERVRAGLVEVSVAADEPDPACWRFDSAVLRRLRSMRHIERCFDAPPELAALVSDLEEEIAALRRAAARLPR
jgi:chaperone modulatory protein CbpM